MAGTKWISRREGAAGGSISKNTALRSGSPLTKLNVERHIEVDVSMDELDVTAAESKATYNEIRDYVWEHHQLKVSNLYIAQVKQKRGIIERENYHKAKMKMRSSPSVRRKRGCDCGSIKAFSDDLIYSMSV